MKPIFAALTLLALAGPAAASPSAAVVCESYKALAEEVMRGRQLGLSLDQSLLIADGIAEPALRAQMEGLARAAHAAPIETTAGGREASVAIFGSRQATACYRSFIAG